MYQDNVKTIAKSFGVQCAACSAWPDRITDWLSSKSLPFIQRSAYSDEPIPDDPDLIIVAIDRDHPEEVYFRNPKHEAMFIADGYGEPT